MQSSQSAAESASHYATWKKYQCMHASVARMSIREKRHIFSLIRDPGCTQHTLLVAYGMTVGDFCAMNILTEPMRRS